jgi:hypothetical protein
MHLKGLIATVVGLLGGIAALAACASATPPSRLADYVGQQALGESVSVSTLPEQRPVRAGLVVISDTTAPDAAPPLPDEALTRLSEKLKQEFSQFLPIAVEKIIPADGIQPDGAASQFSELGKKHGVEYLLVVVGSSTEQEYPMYVFLGWTSHMQPGFRRDNWSLLEVALVEVKTGQTLLHAEGRAWATLDSPMAPGINQWYPVVYLRPQDPERHWWPPTFAGAPNTLRVIAMNQAAKRLILNLQDAWNQKRQAEVTPARG